MTLTHRRAGWLAILLAAAFFLVLWKTAPDMGYTRDEGYYFKAADEYSSWWSTVFSRRFVQAFSDEEIKRAMSYNTEHPAFLKLWFGVTHAIVDTLGLGPHSQGYRAGGFFFAALSLLATFLLARLLVSKEVALVAMLLLALIPRYFYDAHLACFDVAITAMWALSLWAFWRAFIVRENDPRRRRKILMAGVVFGFALATKLNALFLPVVFVVVWLWTFPFGQIRLSPGPSGGRDLALPAIPWALISCALIGPLIFLITWPYLWHDPIGRTGAYIGFHLHHEHYPILFFHDLWVKPPFPKSFALVMTLFTVPLPLIVLGTAGIAVSLWRMFWHRSGDDALLLLGTLLPLALFALPGTPIFGGVKHWYNAMPTLCIVAARALVDGLRAIRTRWPRRGAPVAGLTLALALLPGLLGILRSHPYGIGYYNELAGGFRGGAELGMQRGFWGGYGGAAISRIATLPPPAQVFFNRLNYDDYRMYQKEGRLPPHVYYANDAKGDVAAGIDYVGQVEHAEKGGEIWSSIGTRPSEGVYQDNTVLIQLFIRGEANRPPK